MLTGRGLRLAFGAAQALDDVDLSVAPGEVVAVVGPAGSGKSTLLHVLSGVLVPDGGLVTFEGQELNGLPDDARSAIRLRRFGFVFESGDLIPELSLLENVELPLRLQGRRDSAAGLLKELDLADVADRRPWEAPGDQVLRAAVARALVHDPAVVFADEPVMAVGDAAGELLLDAFTGAARRRDAAIVLATRQARVAAYADRTVFLHDGRPADSPI
ncbi:ATP-binding cassette domain-containing protein [Dactylosporangium sp. NPDC006015]|uniref:ABC transporter ATP-binding protein n=1 Tax=Dactylosporangium sp. NPDC006015 TaxID=3154576 RepID=UPI0033A24D5E